MSKRLDILQDWFVKCCKFSTIYNPYDEKPFRRYHCYTSVTMGRTVEIKQIYQNFVTTDYKNDEK